MRDGVALARHVNLPFALTSEICHRTSGAETCHFVTLLNSCGTATLLLGTRHASVKSVDDRYTQRTVYFFQLTRRITMKVIGFEEHYGLPAIYEAAKKANDPYLEVLEALKKAGH